jgi:hypothetical protein
MIDKISNIFTRPFPYLRKIEFFRRVLYIFLLFNALTLLPVAHDLFGYYGLIGTRGWNTDYGIFEQGSYSFLNVLSHPANSVYTWVYLVFVWGQIGFLILGIFKILPRISSVMIYFFTVNLFLKGYLAFTGGEVLVNFMLFYLMFIHKPNRSGGFGVFQNVLNNTFYWILLIQVCILYFFSGLYKTLDPNWLSGNAMMYVSRIPEYSGDSLRFLFADNPVFSLIFTYMTLAYQLSFPVLVWIKRIKIPFLIVGVLFHLAIWFGMGIFTFAIFMIISYLLFLDDKQIDWIQSKMSWRKKAIT